MAPSCDGVTISRADPRPHSSDNTNFIVNVEHRDRPNQATAPWKLRFGQVSSFTNTALPLPWKSDRQNHKQNLLQANNLHSISTVHPSQVQKKYFPNFYTRRTPPPLRIWFSHTYKTKTKHRSNWKRADTTPVVPTDSQKLSLIFREPFEISCSL